MKSKVLHWILTALITIMFTILAIVSIKAQEKKTRKVKFDPVSMTQIGYRSGVKFIGHFDSTRTYVIDSIEYISDK